MITQTHENSLAPNCSTRAAADPLERVIWGGVVEGVVGGGAVLATVGRAEGEGWSGVAVGVGTSLPESKPAREADWDEFWRSELEVSEFQVMKVAAAPTCGQPNTHVGSLGATLRRESLTPVQIAREDGVWSVVVVGNRWN